MTIGVDDESESKVTVIIGVDHVYYIYRLVDEEQHA